MRTLKQTVVRRILCVFTAAVLVLTSGCGKRGNPDDNTVQQVNSGSSEATVIERDFVGVNVSTPEYIGGVHLISENGNMGIHLKNFEHASVYCYTLDREFYSIEKPLKSEDIIKKYINDLEKKFGVKFNVSSDFKNEVYYSNLSTNSGTVGIAVCNGDFDKDMDSEVSVAIQLPGDAKGSSAGGGDSSSGNNHAASGDISGYWKAAYYVADNGNTVRTDEYSIFAYNTGSASLYIGYDRYEGAWKSKDKGFEFTFVGLHGYGEMAKINNGDYLLVQFDSVDGQIAFENLY